MTNDQIAALAIIVASIFTLGYCVLRAFGAHERPNPYLDPWRKDDREPGQIGGRQ